MCKASINRPFPYLILFLTSLFRLYLRKFAINLVTYSKKVSLICFSQFLQKFDSLSTTEPLPTIDRPTKNPTRIGLIKLQAWNPTTSKQAFCCQYCEIFYKSFFYRTSSVAASKIHWLLLCSSHKSYLLILSSN